MNSDEQVSPNNQASNQVPQSRRGQALGSNRGKQPNIVMKMTVWTIVGALSAVAYTMFNGSIWEWWT